MPRTPPRMPGSSGPSLSGRAKPAADRPAPKRASGGGGGGRRPPKRKKRAAMGGFWSGLYIRLFNRRMFARLLSIGLTLTIVGLILLAWFAHDLPDISRLAEPRKTLGIQVLAADNELIKNYGDIYGDNLSFKDFPKPLIDAVLATEDRKFFYHFGVDPLGILRAVITNVIHGRTLQGGSTITQQLAKNVFLTPERTLKRKLQEMLLAFWLESRFSKEQILSIYLNRVYLGAGNYGVDAASRHYFHKSARDLKLPEAAMIAGLLKAPSRYSPTSDVELAKNRAHQVLLNMVDADMLNKEQAEAAYRQFALPQDVSGPEGRSSRYFADWVVDQLPELLPNLQDDIVIRTTLDPKAQLQAESALEAVMTPEVMQKKKASQVAVVSMKPTGAIIAMIGGRDYGTSQYNRAAQAKRQTGSSFKMFVYLAAMEAGYRPDTPVNDAPITITTPSGRWTPHNYTGKYLGQIALREAVAESINTVAVQVSQAVGIDNVITAARRLGVTSDLDPVPALALGAADSSLLEMTGAYAHYAAAGMAVRPYGISEIRRKKDNYLMFDRRDTGAVIVLSKDTVAKMNNLLAGVINGGTGRGANIGRPAAGKTGTTSDYKDAWFIGYTPDLATGVWIGNDDNAPTAKVTGGNLPAMIWSGYMKQAEAGYPVSMLPMSYGEAATTLPWLAGTPAAEGMPATAPLPSLSGAPAPANPQPAAPQPKGEESGDLGPGFWNKLFDGGKVEYSYPSQRRPYTD